MKPITRVFFLILVTLLLNACASQQPSLQQPNVDEQTSRLASLNTWLIEGKIAFRGPSNNNSGYLKWQQTNDSYAIRVHGPLGQGNREINGNGSYIELSLPAGTVSSDQPEQFLYEQTGWTLPISELRYWVKGLAAPSLGITHIKQDIYITKLSQNGWDISYSKHQLINSVWLPGKIIISKDLYKVIILAKDWTLTN
ncbi:MAG: lipoprotein insertase outer membrane protein LolB [Sinobacterium sp.]|jgi:outer membrane lipoprotein LolB